MIPGVSYPSWRSGATFALASGSADADYPVTNLADLKRIRRVFRSSGAGAIAITCVLAASRAVELVALAHHNATAGKTYRVRLFSDASMTSLAADSGTLTFAGPGAAGFAQVTPVLFASAVTARAARIDLSDLGAAWEIGGVEIAGFWDLSNLSALTRGLKGQDPLLDVGDGVTHATRQFSPRTVGLGRERIDTEIDGATYLDFQMANGLFEPFVWTRSASDSATWGREAMLARLSSLDALTKNAVTLGAFSASLVEHLG